jgi:hypothetical protein
MPVSSNVPLLYTLETASRRHYRRIVYCYQRLVVCLCRDSANQQGVSSSHLYHCSVHLKLRLAIFVRVLL